MVESKESIPPPTTLKDATRKQDLVLRVRKVSLLKNLRELIVITTTATQAQQLVVTHTSTTRGPSQRLGHRGQRRHYGSNRAVVIGIGGCSTRWLTRSVRLSPSLKMLPPTL